ncbi:MAG TPA: flagellar basal body-associated FliL family protein [Acidimicrobiia bacterium]|jgi:flagellar basal body-associated protein FliL
MAKKEKGDGEAPKKSKAKLFMVVGLLIVLGLGAKMTILAPKSKAACAAPGTPLSGPTVATVAPTTTVPPVKTATTASPTQATVGTTTTTACAAAPAPDGGVLKLDSTTINLADGRYLKVGIALQLPASTDLKTFTSDDGGARALDITIRLLGSKGYNDLISVKNRNAIQTTLTQQVVDAYEGKVKGVYFTEFVMQ